MMPETSPAVRRILDKAELCFRLAGMLGNRAGAERLAALVLADFYLEEADRVASSHDRRHRPHDPIADHAIAMPAEELDLGAQHRPRRHP
jgi:hypothetical protein